MILAAVSLVLAFSSAGWADSGELNHIKQAIKEKGAKWQAAETSLLKLTPEQRKKRLGLKKPRTWQEEEMAAAQVPLLSFQPAPVQALPTGLDWRSYPGNSSLLPGNYVTSVRNQGNCGSCWAFATTAALESNVLITERIPGDRYNFAEQVLVACSGAGSCSGGYISQASNYIRDMGLPVESCFPYTGTNNNCVNACSSYQTNTYDIYSWSWVATTAPTVRGIKNALATYGPLVTTMDVYADFYWYRGGVYSYTTGTYQGSHAIVIVGFDENNQCLIVKNSWGTGWGESGFFRVAYNQLSSRVNFGKWTIAYVGDATNPPPPPPPSCTYTISPTSKAFAATGGTSTVKVTTSSSCSWTAKSNASWLSIKSGSNYRGSATVTYAVAVNTSTRSRTGTLTIAGKTFTVTQSGAPNRFIN